MPAQLVFFRFLSQDRIEWRYADGRIRRGAPSEWAAETVGARQILVAPGEALMLNSVAVPSRNRATWGRAVPYALEDQLIEDIESLHFALGSAVDGERLPVAVIGHAALRAWLDVCAQHGLTPVAAIPEPLLIPWREGEWSLLLENRRAVVRMGLWAGFSTERDMLGLLLDRVLSEGGNAKPTGLRIWGWDAASFSEPALSGCERQIETEPGEPLALFASGYQPGATLNLLQGPYGRQTPWGRWLKPWRAAAALAAACLLVQGFTSIYQHWRLQQETLALGAEMERVYKDALPDATRIVNPKAQLEAHLKELRPSGGGEGVFLDLLNRGAQPLIAASEVVLRGFNYRDGQLDLSLQGGNPAALDQLRQQLNQQPGLQAEMRTSQREGQIESKVTLKKAAP
ncbi:MAG: type II secretion system protein GspL [Candidatus Competibacteraceae bacterium]|nr:type II secretion system protein GspL [Candidatus Competibacteraceae bacterium]